MIVLAINDWIGYLIGALASLFLGCVFSLIIKPFKRKEYGLRFEEDYTKCTILDPSITNIKKNSSNPQVITKSYSIRSKIIVTNNGKNDILKNDIVYPLQILIPQEYIIKSASITDPNIENKAKIKSSINEKENSITIIWDILEKDSNFSIMIDLICNETEDEYPSEIENYFYDSLEMSITAKNIKKISKSHSSHLQSIITFLVGYFTIFVFFPSFILSLLIKEPEYLPLDCTYQYAIETDSLIQMCRYNGSINYNIKTNEMALSNEVLDTIITMPIEQFDKSYEIKELPINKYLKARNRYKDIFAFNIETQKYEHIDNALDTIVTIPIECFNKSIKIESLSLNIDFLTRQQKRFKVDRIIKTASIAIDILGAIIAISFILYLYFQNK